jgi:hypothetical protein
VVPGTPVCGFCLVATERALAKKTSLAGAPIRQWWYQQLSYGRFALLPPRESLPGMLASLVSPSIRGSTSTLPSAHGLDGHTASEIVALIIVVLARGGKDREESDHILGRCLWG